MPIFLKVNHQLESRIQEIWQSGSEGGGASALPTPIIAQGLPWVIPRHPISPEGATRYGENRLRTFEPDRVRVF